MEEILKELVEVQKGIVKELSSLNTSLGKLEKQFTPQKQFVNFSGNIYEIMLKNLVSLEKIQDNIKKLR